MTSKNRDPLSEKECLDSLARAISDVGYWTWWTPKLPSLFQLEFAGTQLYFPTTEPAKPPSSQIAIQFRNPNSISFISTDVSTTSTEPQWFDLLHDDKMEPPSCAHDFFTFTDDSVIRKIVTAAKTINTIQGYSPKTDEIWSAHYRLAFWAGKVGMIISADAIKLWTKDGELKLNQIPDINAQWWEYWKDYWALKNTPTPKPRDYACEVTIPMRS